MKPVALRRPQPHLPHSNRIRALAPPPPRAPRKSTAVSAVPALLGVAVGQIERLFFERFLFFVVASEVFFFLLGGFFFFVF
jgi:hypothetical protein